MSKRIAFIAHLSELSGSGTSLVETASAMRLKFETVLILPGEGDLVTRARMAGIEPVIIDNPEVSITDASIQQKAALVKARFSYIRALAKYLRDNEITVACINTSTSVFAGMAARLAGVSIVWRIHESLATRDKRTRIKTALIRRWSRGLIYDSKAGMQNLPHPEGKPALVARNYIRIDDLAELGKQRLAGPISSLTAPRIITNGTIARKGADVLLEAVRLLDHELQVGKASVFIVGSPPAEPSFASKLDKLATTPELAGRVTFTGLSSSLAPQLAEADIFVSPSHNEALPIAMVEAIAAGLPVIATDVGDCADLLENGQCGWIVPPGNPEALAQALSEAVTQPEVARKKADAAFKKIISIYGARDFWQPMEDFLTAVIAQR